MDPSLDLHRRRLENLYHAAPINEYFRPRLSIGDGTADLVMEVRPDMYHAADAAHGVVYFKALDDAAFFAVNGSVPEVFVLTARLDVEFLRPLRAGTVRAHGRVVREEGRRWIAESTLKDTSNETVGKATGEFARSRIRLDSLPGYR